ncbi:alpha/beta fold hydrolase [Dictyobacter arantiisoli]|uniref:Hydrolase n=1 Tax=Dictyobacter arantiisoli TaxID=2014874 RepID=A0A5A5TIB0_9CHLR|nr:alpha/beta hydrolase [Dictyobacter arantiisoli]GCF10955.1 hydrolase [Dictyobacter arantiisoli]
MDAETLLLENGLSLAYERCGTGPTLLLLHAGMADRRMWDAQVEAFAQQYQVIRYDLQGYGTSGLGGGLIRHYEDLYGLLKGLGIAHAFLLGCALGGAVCLDFALLYPEMVDGLILVAALPGGYPVTGTQLLEVDAREKQREQIAAIKAGNFALASEIEVDHWLVGQQRVRAQLDPVVWQRVYDMTLLTLQRRIASYGNERILEPPAYQRLSEIQTSTLLINGTLDDPMIGQAGDWLAAHLPNVQTVQMPETAHFPNIECPAAFNHHVLTFLSRWLPGPLPGTA